jgi:hypothetical protein
MTSGRFDDSILLTGRATTTLELAAHISGARRRVGLEHLLGGLWFEGGGIAAHALSE